MAGVSFNMALTTGHSTAPPTNVVSTQSLVFISGKPALVEGDQIIPHAYYDDPPHNGGLVAQTDYVFIEGIKAGQIGDRVSCGDTVSEGSEFVFME